jgi:bifunctional non-homologous end joining protein LigD
MKWIKFHGKIPEGKYGHGTIEILQNGTCDIMGYSDRYIVFQVEGKYLNGRYALIKMQSNRYKKHKQEEWMLVNITKTEPVTESTFISERFFYTCL